ncbi:MAG TPA: Rieske (2Fe-2S) protein [Planctomycetota bacterium]|nr:Rieske (2Fe-2S) protein [Planctomycetota bacterium]
MSPPPARWLRALPAAELPPGRSARVELEGIPLLLHNAAGAYSCTGALCPHQGRPLDPAARDGPLLTCPWHAWIFDVTTGCAPYNPWARLPLLPVRLGDDGHLYVGLP